MAGARAAGPDRVRDVIWWHVHPLGSVEAEQRAEPDAPVRHRPATSSAGSTTPCSSGRPASRSVRCSPAPRTATTHRGPPAVDRRLGDDADFDALVGACRSRGLRLLLDGVFHHVGRDHPAVRAVLGEGPSAPTAPWSRLRWPGGPRPGRRAPSRGHDDFEGHAAPVALDHTAPAVLDHVAEVMAGRPDRPEQLSALGLPTFRLHQLLIGFRRRHRWLHTARTATLHLTDEHLVHEVATDGERLVVALHRRPADLPAARAGALLAGTAEVVAGGSDDARVRLAPQGWAVLAG